VWSASRSGRFTPEVENKSHQVHKFHNGIVVICQQLQLQGLSTIEIIIGMMQSALKCTNEEMLPISFCNCGSLLL
jgi:hypothetical protein